MSDYRCTHVDAGLRCVRAPHPADPDAHVRLGTFVPDAHTDAEEDVA
jgi:hypothetical protein